MMLQIDKHMSDLIVLTTNTILRTVDGLESERTNHVPFMS